jgi:hypothetical protein
MAETWNERWRREVREVHAAVDALLERDPSGPALRQALEAAAQVRWFNQLSYKWAPWLWRKLEQDRSQRAVLRPFLLSHLDASALDQKGRFVRPWREGKSLEKWLADVDAAADIEVFRHVIQWKLHDSWKDFAKRWRELLLQRVKAARTSTERQDALARFDFPAELDEPAALSLYESYGSTARRFILDRLPWRGGLWEQLHSLALRRHDDETAWQLYRRQVEPARWAKDVRSLITTTSDGETLVAELEKRHPQVVTDAGPVLLELAQKKGVAALPYLQRHVRAVFPRWGWFGRTEARSLVELVKLADESAWTSLWAKLLQSSATPELWNSEVKRLLQAASTSTAQHKLRLLTGAGGEWNFSGFGLAQVQPLSDEVACQMYQLAPAMLRGPFRMHLPTAQGFPKLVARVLADDDETLVDSFASRAILDHGVIGETVDKLTAHYEAMSLTDGTFVRRAINALSMMPAFAIWNYERLLTNNKLARLLFERSTPLYLSDARLVRELLESPQIHVQALGFRVLATRDERAVAMAAQQVDVLAPTLLRPLHRRTRLMAFAAMENACLFSETAATALLEKMKQSLALPDRRYPKEELVGLIGRVLARWPKLRGKNEQPQIFRREVA